MEKTVFVCEPLLPGEYKRDIKRFVSFEGGKETVSHEETISTIRGLNHLKDGEITSMCIHGDRSGLSGREYEAYKELVSLVELITSKP